jgi:glycerate dehydrogenase
MKGAFLDLETTDNGDIDFSHLQQTLPEWEFHALTSPNEIKDRLRGVTVAVTNKAVLDRSALESADQLKLVCIAATGTNNVDLDAARELGISVCNVVHYATPSVVQHVFGLVFALDSRILQYHEAVQAGHWARSPHFSMLDFPIRELSGKTMGIVGYGELGRGVAHAAECFGMKVLIAQRPGGPAQTGRLPLHDLLPRVDVLSLHCPLTAETENLISSAELKIMKPDALLINTARGGIVDETALVDALRTGEIGGAGIDTLTTEPPVKGNPLLNYTSPNLIVTPHTAWASRQARQRLVDGVAGNILSFIAGSLTNRVA